MSDSLSVSFRYTKEDIINVVIETLGFDVLRCWLLLLSTMFFIFAGVYCFWIKLHVLTIVFAFIAISIVPIYITIAYLSLALTLKILTDCVYTLEKNQLIAGSNLGFQYFKLRDIDRVVLTKPVLFIYVTQKNAYFIPIRAFSSEEKANKFITELEYGIEVAKREEEEIRDL